MAREPSRLSPGNQGSKRALSFMAATMSMAGFDTASCVHHPRVTPLAQSFRFSGKIQEKIQEKHFKEKSALHAPSVAVVRSFMVNLGGPPATCLDRRLYFPLWLGSSIGGSGIRIELKNQEVITPCRCKAGFGVPNSRWSE